MTPARLLSVCLCLLAFHTLSADDPFKEGVRPTEPLPPEAQAKSFHLPPGFEIQLVATEPDLNKPFNLAFDVTGRLWVTTSIEYPFAAPTNAPGRDRLMIFEDFGPDGKARKVTEFAGGLNIPIGVYPFRTADLRWKCIVWSIPNIWLLEDTDGDGKADKREVLYGPFDYTRDTHGNQASFRRGFDGWLYATHGFNNDSHVTARDGSRVDLNSGNTYRIRLDGTRIEHHTHGQVNPFGLAWDARGNLYSSDCHSAPIYQLLAGGWYPSFGKPHDGLGFAPVMIEHAHGSTAIDGAFYYSDNLWPAEFQDNFFIGNVMTSRLNRDQITFTGSTPKATEQPDFLTTDDPWFRPVDNILGPDGALYIADFYNRIIGHYEVPLTHPGRDRERGRIWRVVYKGPDGKATLRDPKLPADLKGLVHELGSPNLTRRLLAMNDLADRFGSGATGAVQSAVDQPDNPFQQVHALWLLHRLNPPSQNTGPTPSALTLAARSRDPLVRTHAQRIAADMLAQDRGVPIHTDYIQAGFGVAIDGLKDPDALVQRCAAEALGEHLSSGNVERLLELLARTPPTDTHLIYVARKSLKQQLENANIFAAVTAKDWPGPALRTLMDVALAVKSEPAAEFLLKHFGKGTPDEQFNLRILQHAARHASVEMLTLLAEVSQARIPKSYGLPQYQELARQFDLFRYVDDGWKQRGGPMPAPLRAWGTNIAGAFFGALDTYHSWSAAPYEPSPTAIPWDVQSRPCADGVTREVTSSIVHGEHLTGVLRSPSFEIPSKLSFWLCGHNGFPDQPDHQKNVIRLREARTRTILAEAYPPRNDTARRITWDLTAHAGKLGYVEAVDGDTARAYAWLAFGGFDPLPSALRPSEFQPRQMRDWMIAALNVAERVQLKELAPVFARWGNPNAHTAQAGDEIDPDLLEAFARAWITLDRQTAVTGLVERMARSTTAQPNRERLGVVLAEANDPAAQAALAEAFKTVPTRVQQRWANALATSADGAETLLTAAEQGAVARSLLSLAGLRNRIRAAQPRDWEARLNKLTQDLPADSAVRQQLIDARKASFQTAKADHANGATVYAQVCAVCHQLGGQGALVGPQLDGIGNRGLERVLEDILDPNRNVDHAFRSQIIVLKDGEIVTGLLRREEGALLIVVDSTGKEFSLEKSQIASRRESDTSLMPDNLGEALTEAQLRDLVSYLLASGTAAAKATP